MMLQHWHLTVPFSDGHCVQLAAATHGGNRTVNEDNLIALAGMSGGRGRACMIRNALLIDRIQGWADQRIRCAVFDGVGGHAGGREAAEAGAEWLMAQPPTTSVTELCLALHRFHAGLSSEHGAGSTGATTVAVIEIDLRTMRAWRLHVGDSRIYLRRRSRYRRLSCDHRQEEMELRAGRLAWPEYRKLVTSPSNRLSQAVGIGRLRIDEAAALPGPLAHHADAEVFQLSLGDDLLLCTDGLFGAAMETAVLDDLGRLGPNGLAPTVDAVATSGVTDDNVTAILIRLEA